MSQVNTRAPERRARATVCRTVVAMVSALAAVAAAAPANAKTPGSTYCFYKTCHRVQSIAETQALVGQDMTLVASHYDSCKRDRYNPCGLTSSGERFNAGEADNAASPIFPDGTILLAWSKASQEAVVLRINNAGPYWGNRKLDLSRAAARRLGVAGVGKVSVRILKAPTREEARYKKYRVYDAVPGPIGRFASLDSALSGLVTLVASNATGTSGLIAADEPMIAALQPTPAQQLAAAAKAEFEGTQMTAAAAPKVAAIEPFEWPVVYDTVKPKRFERAPAERRRTLARIKSKKPAAAKLARAAVAKKAKVAAIRTPRLDRATREAGEKARAELAKLAAEPKATRRSGDQVKTKIAIKATKKSRVTDNTSAIKTAKPGQKPKRAASVSQKGWTSSEVREPLPNAIGPALTGPRPNLPFDLKNEFGVERPRRWIVRPSALA